MVAKWQAEEDKIPELPEGGSAQGVLPRIIATLVGRRRQTKALMKDKTATPAKLMQVNLDCFRVREAQTDATVRHQAAGAQAYCQFNVRVSGLCRKSIFVSAPCGSDDVQGARDLDADEGAGRGAAAGCELLALVRSSKVE